MEGVGSETQGSAGKLGKHALRTAPGDDRSRTGPGAARHEGKRLAAAADATGAATGSRLQLFDAMWMWDAQ